ncbi:MAG: anti-sigma factor [Actinomycetota bacterium]|nr:anti-sigma factor [Actinomycetota bacterium]
MGEHRDHYPASQAEHARTWELIGPYVLGALNPEEEGTVERHLTQCATCHKEEGELRETHERIAGASIAASSVPPDLKSRVLESIPHRERSGPARGMFPLGRTAVAAAAVLLLFALSAVAYSVGLFGGTTEKADLASTELAPEAGGELKVRDSGTAYEASLEVWGLPQTGPDEYYELWFGRKDGRVSVGTFTVDEGGRGKISAICPEVAGEYERVGITLERFPEEPSVENARVMLRGDLQSA